MKDKTRPIGERHAPAHHSSGPNPHEGHLEAVRFHDDGPWAVHVFTRQDGSERRIEFPVRSFDADTGRPTNMSPHGRWLDGEGE